MVEKLGVFPSFFSLTNLHLGIVVQNLAEKRHSPSIVSNRSKITTSKSEITRELPEQNNTEDGIFNLDISGGEIVGRAVLLNSKSDVEIDRFWVFGAARSDEDIERSNYQLLRKLPKSFETHSFVNECYQVFLERSADSDGLANYAHMLKTKHLSPRDFIKVLLTSPEGNNYVETLVVVPYPSPHLKKRDRVGMHS
jgi:Domain of unknown function (DUF4214)